VKFGATNAGGPYTNVSNTNVTFKVPTGLAVGAHTITISNFDGSAAITVGVFNVTAVPGTLLTAPMVAKGSKFGGAVMGPLSLAGTYTPVTLAPTLTFAALNYTHIATDGTHIYAYGYANSNANGFGPGIYKINKASGATSVLATGTVVSLTSDGTDVFVATSGVVGSLGKSLVSSAVNDINLFKITPAGSVSLISTLSSTGLSRFSSPIVVFAGPIAVAGGKLHIKLYGTQLIKSVDLATNAVSTLTYGDNSCNAYIACDGTGANTVAGTGASFNGLSGSMTTDGTYLYLLEAGNAHPGFVRQISLADGSVKTLGGIARFLFANYSSWLIGTGITTDGAGNVYVVSPSSSQIIKYDIATGNASVTATGSAAAANCASNTGTLNCAGLNGGVTSDGTNLFTFNGGVLVKIQ
jgi:hypothetical protein